VKKMPPRSVPSSQAVNDAQIPGGRLRDQPAREGADQRAFLRAFGGAEGGREELRDRLNVGGVIR
jgi:hypothetical protein